MYYVYLLRSLAKPNKTYVGYTEDTAARLQKHNAGEVPSTCGFRPWEIVAYIATPSREKAVALERYLKSGSGHAFAHRHLW